MKYAFGTYVLSTPIPLPSLPQIADAGDATLVIRVGWTDARTPARIDWLHHWRDGSQVLLSLAQQASHYVLRVPGLADFLLDIDQRTVRIAPIAESLDTATLEHVLVDQVLPRLLSQLGDTLVHAGAVRICHRHLLFLGNSGWGKSTLSGLLHRAGHPVLSDDCLQLFVAPDGCVRMVPTYPSLRLNPDSLQTLFPGQDTTMPFAGYSGKRRVPIAASESPRPMAEVDALYVLGDPRLVREGIRITPASPAEACHALIRHSFRLDLSDPEGSALLLRQCAAIARAKPAFTLHYPHDHHRNATLLQTLLGHVETLPAGRGSSQA